VSWKAFVVSLAASLTAVATCGEVFFENYYIEIRSYNRHIDACDDMPEDLR
jgi:hypothetical protein